MGRAAPRRFARLAIIASMGDTNEPRHDYLLDSESTETVLSGATLAGMNRTPEENLRRLELADHQLRELRSGHRSSN